MADGLGPTEKDPERVEIRRCFPKDVFGPLQIAAWSRHDAAPRLIVETSDVIVTQLASVRGVVVVQLSHETTDVVRVIAYERGVPRLMLEEPVKRTVAVVAREDAVSVEFVDAGHKRRQYTFKAAESERRSDQP
jgi:hypothetical protein